MTNVIFFRVGWMKRYQGISTDDKLEGGAKHLVENKWGHELFNFKEYNGYFYGYVPPANKRSRSIKLERINSDFKNAEVLHNVLIIWTATKNGGIYIVGWYKHADVYQYQQNDIKGREYNGEVIGYSTKAKMEDVVLLPIEERTYKIPYGKGWSGESHVWYAEEQEEFKEKVKRYVEAYKESKKSTSFIIGKEYVDNPDKQDEQEQNEFIAIEAEKTREEIISDLKGVTPKSPELVEVRGKQYRRDNGTIVQLKILRNYECQICHQFILKKDGKRYIEAAHIIPKRHQGPELPNNLLILCPNHHKEFDLGDIKISLHDTEKIIFELNGITRTVNLSLQ